MKKLLITAAFIAAFSVTAFADIAPRPGGGMYESLSPAVIAIIVAAVCTVVVRIIKKILNRRR